jgi:hypothetical protein
MRRAENAMENCVLQNSHVEFGAETKICSGQTLNPAKWVCHETSRGRTKNTICKMIRCLEVSKLSASVPRDTAILRPRGHYSSSSEAKCLTPCVCELASSLRPSKMRPRSLNIPVRFCSKSACGKFPALAAGRSDPKNTLAIGGVRRFQWEPALNMLLVNLPTLAPNQMSLRRVAVLRCSYGRSSSRVRYDAMENKSRNHWKREKLMKNENGKV